MIDNKAVMQQAPEQLNEIHSRIRAAGGIVHKDGNIFFTNADKFLAAIAQPVHESIASDAIECVAQPAKERNFCPRCGKRLGGIDDVHTCTPVVQS